MKYFLLILSICYTSNDKSIDFLLEAETSMILEDYLNAEKHYLKALNHSPNNSSILMSLYEVNLLQGKINNAENYIRKVYISNKKDMDVLKKYYNILLLKCKEQRLLKVVETIKV